MELDLTDRRVLVVGASSGIGRTIAEMAAESGARVAVSARRAEQLAEIAAGLPGGTAIPGDVRTEGDPARIVAEAAEALGGLDAVVYATGVSPLKPLADATLADWQSVLETNLVGAALVSAAAAPLLLESHGRLLLLSSKSVRRPFPDLSLYSTSKMALDGFITCLRTEYPELEITRVVIGNTAGTDFANAWDTDALMEATARWAESGVLGSAGMMHPRQVAQGILAVVAARGHIDDIAIIDRSRDDGSW